MTEAITKVGVDVRPNYYRAEVKVFMDDAQDEKMVRTVECFDLIDSLAGGDFYIGNAWKYLFRFGRKSKTPMKDVEKAITYLQQWRERELENLPF